MQLAIRTEEDKDNIPGNKQLSPLQNALREKFSLASKFYRADDIRVVTITYTWQSVWNSWK